MIGACCGLFRSTGFQTLVFVLWSFWFGGLLLLCNRFKAPLHVHQSDRDYRLHVAEVLLGGRDGHKGVSVRLDVLQHLYNFVIHKA